MSLAIKAENLSKAYQLGEVGTGTISRDLERWFAKVRGKEDPFLKVGEINNQTIKGSSDIVWSLKDINFEIKEGDAVGIIGRNGAGKSTLLKLLSRVTSPTTGEINVKGRIASLLEVGTGFHPDLTGRENIYLNGAILGMRKKEIRKKFDEIVDFAGVQRYIDTPVKRYSSGMYVRLAFAVAAHLESEILIVDEVLAVGDAEFQSKCLGKMGDISKGEGRTVLFVSHNMSSITALCNKGIVLKQGGIKRYGPISDCIKEYQGDNVLRGKKTEWRNLENKFIDESFSISRAALIDKDNRIITDGIWEKNKMLCLLIEGTINELNPALKIGYELRDCNQVVLFTSLTTDTVPANWPRLNLGKNYIVTQIPVDLLLPGSYSIYINISLHHQKWICSPKEGDIVLDFTLIDDNTRSAYFEANTGLIDVKPMFKLVDQI